MTPSPLTPPVDSRTVVEIAPGVFVPDSRFDQVMEAIASNPAVAEAIAEINLERTSADGLSGEDCIFVPFWFLAAVQERMAANLFELSQANAAKARQVRSVTGAFLSFGRR